MKKGKLLKYWMFSMVLVLVISAYPLYMGISVISDMMINGKVMAEDYPKYVIPYTPISVAVLFALIVMPIVLKLCGKLWKLVGDVLSVLVFLVTEVLFEKLVIVTDTVMTTLESWQMFMCYVTPQQMVERTRTPVDILIGEYSEMFKLHFYVIAVLLVVAFVGCFYGFADVIVRGKREKLMSLTVLSAITVLFLALCIFACFTAFFRTGEITVSPLSALLMAVFFIVMGMTGGIFASLYLRRGRSAAVVSSVIACVVAVIMYIGEMILLGGNLYRFGSGIFFDGLGVIVLAPVDIMIVVLSGVFTFALTRWLGGRRR